MATEKMDQPEFRTAEQPTPMNLDDYLLSHLAQECAEVIVRCTKAQHFGLDEVQPEQPLTNRQRIAEELADVQAMIFLMQDIGILPEFSDRDLNARISAKHRKAKRFREYSRELGRLEAR